MTTPRLTKDDVRSILDPHLGPIESLAPIIEGGDHHTWLVNDTAVARFALDDDGVRKQRLERDVREVIRPVVSAPLPQPLMMIDRADGLTCLVDEWMPGTSIERHQLAPGGLLQLAAFLREMRAVPVDLLRGMGINEQPPIDLDALIADAASRTEVHDENSVDAERVSSLAAPDNDAAPVVIHADLKGEHMFADDAGALIGIVDWSDVALGDQATDVAGVIISIGADLAQATAKAAHVSDATFLRGLVIARCRSIIEVADVLAGNSLAPEQLVRRQMRRAWTPVMPFSVGTIDAR